MKEILYNNYANIVMTSLVGDVSMPLLCGLKRSDIIYSFLYRNILECSGTIKGNKYISI